MRRVPEAAVITLPTPHNLHIVCPMAWKAAVILYSTYYYIDIELYIDTLWFFFCNYVGMS